MGTLSSAASRKLNQQLIQMGKSIRRAREKLGLNQEDMVPRGFNLAYFKAVEAGRANPTMKFWFRLCEALQIEFRDIVKE